jgi:dihydroneopterin aldolase
LIQRKEHPLRITIKGLEIFAYHGVLPEEREKGQLFLFDVGLSLRSTAAPDTDDIADTVDYAAVCDSVFEVATGATYNLLEKLAAVTADEILRRFPSVDRVKVRIAKASAPIEYKLDQVAVMLKRSRP